MRLESSSGLTLVELVVVVTVLLVLATSIVPSLCLSSSVRAANLVAVGSRGRDIYVAITGANTEREALGMPPLWPRDFDPAVDAGVEELAHLDFENSTDYFKWLIDEANRNTPDWSPYVAELDYSKLAGAGVSACPRDQTLSASNNLWTVVKNVREDMDDIIPVLVTRNIDASSLAVKISEKDFRTKSVRFDPVWRTPFSGKGFVMIRKDGAIFKSRSKYMTYGVVYAKQTFDTTHTPDGRSAPPLKYLTPTREVTLNDEVYSEEAARAYNMAGGWWGQLTRDVQDFFAVVWPIALFLAILYLPFFAHSVARRKRLGLCPAASAPIIGVWLCHGLAMTFYAASLFGHEEPWFWGYIGAALAAQVFGIALALVFQRSDGAARWRQVLWVLLVPLQLAVVLVLLSFCCVWL